MLPAVVAIVQRDGEPAVGVEGDQVEQRVAVEAAERDVERLRACGQNLVGWRGDAQQDARLRGRRTGPSASAGRVRFRGFERARSGTMRELWNEPAHAAPEGA
jgi:hypothetical protein